MAVAALLAGCGQAASTLTTVSTTPSQADPILSRAAAAPPGDGAQSGAGGPATDGEQATDGGVLPLDSSPSPDADGTSIPPPPADDPAGPVDTTAGSVPAQDGEPGPTSDAGPPADVGDTDPGAGEPAGYSSSVSEIDGPLADRMASSWRPGCPVPLSDLRYLTVTYRGFDGADHNGELVVASSVTADVATIFEALYARRLPHRVDAVGRRLRRQRRCLDGS